MLNRFLQPLPLATSRRAYSFFSSKPGGGRYFNSAKPHKVAPATATSNASAKSKARTDETSSTPSPTSPPTQEDGPSQVVGHEDAQPTSPSSQSSVFSSQSSPASTPPLPLHPNFSSHTYPLHQFFAFHRPLLLLPLPTSTLFDTPATSFEEATSPQRPESAMQTLPFGEHPDTPADADVDVARQMARTLAMNHVGNCIDWEETLARLGDADSIHALQRSIPVCDVNMDSTKRKKRRKMSKHKYKKRRRLQRSERRKMGK